MVIKTFSTHAFMALSKYHPSVSLFTSVKITKVVFITTLYLIYVACERPSIANGTFSPSLTTHGTSVVISCDSGFSLVGTSNLTCNDGAWDKPLPTCHKSKGHFRFMLFGPEVIKRLSYSAVTEFINTEIAKINEHFRFKLRKPVIYSAK